ncbi:unnamed protein product [Symbiodinium microadriaticum]|nr:unnamed protein product [Symbiodinium microadriaticum]CAE7940649.1 unnamed protein product [Symbiodinium sp. KB8]
MKAERASGKFPTLAQKHLSGAESIILVRWLAAICWDIAAKTGSHHDRLRASVFIGLDQLRDTFAKCPGVPSEEELEKAEFFKDLYQGALLGALASVPLHVLNQGPRQSYKTALSPKP